jgi:hypothetical protein
MTKKYWLRGLLIGVILSLLYIPFAMWYEASHGCESAGLCGVWIFGFPFISIPAIIVSWLIGLLYGKIKNRKITA